MYVCMYVCMDGWMDVWMDGCMYGWMDVCIYIYMICICTSTTIIITTICFECHQATKVALASPSPVKTVAKACKLPCDDVPICGQFMGAIYIYRYDGCRLI